MPPGSRTSRPSLRLERSLLREGVMTLACADEVGRGALSGPVTVGMVLIDASIRTAPTGLRDSKLLTEQARDRLAPKVRRWALAHSVGHAEPAEIDEVGIIGALRLAGRRALAGLGARPDMILLDGNHDYLSSPGQASLFDAEHDVLPAVRTAIKADMRCSGVAAASVLAKTTRDALMKQLAGDFPGYGWEINKGYASPEHIDALRALGPCEMHRRSWNLPGCAALDSAAPESVYDRADAAPIQETA